MVASGVCHSCLHTYDGSHSGAPMPIVLGDEGSGVIDEVGAGVTRLRPGDHVIVSWAPACGYCRFCSAGFPALCAETPGLGFVSGQETRFHLDGEPLYHYGPATYASHIVAPQSAVVKIRSDFPLDVAALIGCSVSTGFGAAVNTAKVRPGQSVAVIGCGGVGLNAVQGAAVCGANPIVAVDVADSKIDVAKELGATHGINASQEDPVEAIRDICPDGVEVAIVAVGNGRAMEQGIRMLDKRGLCVLVGAAPTGDVLQVDPRLLVGGERRVAGSRYGSGNPHIEFPKMVELAMAGILRVDELVSRRYSLDQADEAFDDLARGDLARGLIVF